MTNDKFQQEIKLFELQHQLKRKAFLVECAKENNPYNVGDVIRNHRVTIRIQTWSVVWYNQSKLPHMQYAGIKLNKDGKDNKRGDMDSIYQDQIIK